MPEIGFGKGAAAGSIGGGFAKGIASAMTESRARKEREKRTEQERQDRLFSALLPVYLENVDDVSQLEPFIQQHFPEMFPNATGAKPGKTPKTTAGGAQASPWQQIAKVLGPFIGMRGKGQISTPVGNDLPEQGGIGGNLPRPRDPLEPGGVAGMEDGRRSSSPFHLLPSWLSGGGGAQPDPAIEEAQITRRRQLGLPVAGEAPWSSPLNGLPGVTNVGPVGALPQGIAPPTGQGGTTAALPQPTNAPPGGVAFDQPPDFGTFLKSQQAKQAAPAQQRRTLLGVPIMSADEKLTRDLDQKTKITAGLMDRARNVVLPELQKVDPNYTLDDALMLLGIDMNKHRGTDPYQSVEGTIDGEPAFASYDRSIGAYVRPGTHTPIPNFKPKTGAESQTYGVDREAISKALYGKTYGKLSREEADVVLAEEKKMLQQEAQSRALGTGQGRFQAPIDIPTAQASGQPVGVSAADVANQRVPTMPQQDQLRTITTIRGDVERVKELISILPSENDPGGSVPGGWLAVRRRLNTPSPMIDPATGQPIPYPRAIARLEAVVDSILGNLARVRQAQVGAQTEKDAERAYNALVNLKAGLTDPFHGDTREAAADRIMETLDGLDRVLAGLPKTPVVTPKPGGGPAPATTPKPAAAPAQPGAQAAPAAGSGAGLKMDPQGNFVDPKTGKIVIDKDGKFVGQQ